jgi:lipoprotein-anchoring transpeptidase ErfK/SrfK
MMFRRCGLLLLTLSVAAAIPVASALAQYYPPPPGYYRSGPPPGAYYDDRRQPPGYWTDDDDDDQPVRPPRRSRQMSQVPPQGPGAKPNLPYPDDDDEADTLPPPGFIPPGAPPRAYGRQLDRRAPAAAPPPAAAETDPDAIRPPGLIGATPPPVPSSATAALPPEDQPEQGQPKELPANLKRQLVDYQTREPPGTIIIDTPNTYLYLVLGNGKAMRYGIGVGREGFTWAGTERISRMKEWPDWFPPAEMIERQPYLPRMMAGGPGNPLGARALYLGNTLYRIHGTNQPSTIGQTVSSGCIRLLNEDIEDLFGRVQVGTRVVVLPGKTPETVANTGAPDTDMPHTGVPKTGAVLNVPNSGAVLNMGPANPAPPPAGNSAAVSSSPLPPVR